MPAVVTEGASETRARHEVPVLTSGLSSAEQRDEILQLQTRDAETRLSAVFPIYALVGPGPSHNRKFRSKRRVQSFSSHAAGIDIRHTISRGEANPAGYNSP